MSAGNAARGVPSSGFSSCALCDLCLIQIRVRIITVLRAPCWNRSPRAATAGHLACASRARSHLRSDPYGRRAKRIDPGNAEVIWAISVLPRPGRQQPTRRPGNERRRPGTASGSGHAIWGRSQHSAARPPIRCLMITSTPVGQVSTCVLYEMDGRQCLAHTLCLCGIQARA